jgi:hypothetical protein
MTSYVGFNPSNGPPLNIHIKKLHSLLKELSRIFFSQKLLVKKIFFSYLKLGCQGYSV